MTKVEVSFVTHQKINIRFNLFSQCNHLKKTLPLTLQFHISHEWYSLFIAKHTLYSPKKNVLYN